MAVRIDNGLGRIYYDNKLIVDNGKVNHAASTNPLNTDDNTQGYAAGSIWINTLLNDAYVCTDASTGAAVWGLMGGSSGSASASASFITATADGGLSHERVLTGTAGQITLTDGGAGSTMTVKLADNPVLPGTGSVTINKGSTGQRPGVASAGQLRFNTTTGYYEGYDGTSWKNFASQDWTNSLASGYQPLDSTLTALAAYNTNGLLTQTGADTFTGRTITGTTDQITVTNGSGVSGNPNVKLADNPVLPGTGSVTINKGTTAQRPTPVSGMLRYNTTTNTYEGYDGTTWTTFVGTTYLTANYQPLDADLTAILALTGTGYLVRTGDGTWTTRSITAGSNKLTITNGNAVAAATAVDVTEANLTLNNIGGTLGISKGGTGQTTKKASFDALAPAIATTGDLLVGTYGGGWVTLPKGTDGHVLVSNSAIGAGVEWTNDIIRFNDFNVQFTVGTGTNATLTFLQSARYKFALDKIYYQTGTGSIKANVRVNGGSVPGWSSLNLTTSASDAAPSSSTYVEAGDKVDIVFSSNAGATNISLMFECTRW